MSITGHARHKELAMPDPQARRPTSTSPAEASRPQRPESSIANPDDRPKRVGVYERLGRSAGLSPAMTLGLAIVILAVIIALIAAFIR
jgi:hypothetical protein